MCSAKAVKQIAAPVARVVSGVFTLGGSEIARNNVSPKSVVGQVLNAPGTIVTGGTSDYGNPASSGPGGGREAAPPAPMPDPIPTATPEPPATPDPSAPGISTLAEQRRRRRLGALRMGILGNIRAGGGDSTTANLLTPIASGGGTTKTLLGQ